MNQTLSFSISITAHFVNDGKISKAELRDALERSIEQHVVLNLLTPSGREDLGYYEIDVEAI